LKQAIPPADGGGHPTEGAALDVGRLLTFFAEHGRNLPWRLPAAGPWAVLVSEFMLQQTPVVRVLPVFSAWMRRWPEPADLAADSAGEAVRAWGRLGYPRRALRLHAAATAIAIAHGGSVPETLPELLRLPGVGEYTARAVAAFAFGARTPVVDTNVRRVLSRAVRGADSLRETATAIDRRELEAQLPVESATAARFSAALMELGALVCTAKAPACSRCPLADRWRLARGRLSRGAPAAGGADVGRHRPSGARSDHGPAAGRRPADPTCCAGRRVAGPAPTAALHLLPRRRQAGCTAARREPDAAGLNFEFRSGQNRAQARSAAAGRA